MKLIPPSITINFCSKSLLRIFLKFCHIVLGPIVFKFFAGSQFCNLDHNSLPNNYISFSHSTGWPCSVCLTHKKIGINFQKNFVKWFFSPFSTTHITCFAKLYVYIYNSQVNFVVSQNCFIISTCCKLRQKTSKRTWNFASYFFSDQTLVQKKSCYRFSYSNSRCWWWSHFG